MIREFATIAFSCYRGKLLPKMLHRPYNVPMQWKFEWFSIEIANKYTYLFRCVPVEILT